MNIQLAVSAFPDFAKSWAEHRLTRFFNQTGSLPNEEMLISVKDYLSSLTPEDRIYQKLNKVSWNDMVQLQKRWHDILADKATRMTEFGGDAEAETFIDCGNGYRWVKLSTPAQLDFEGNAMGHCIGKGGYDESGNHFYSLRDSKNLPHATVEFDPKNKRYLQIQGRANEPVIADYWEDAVKLFNVLGEENGPEKFAHDREYVCSDYKMYFEIEDIKRVINDDSALITSARMKNTSFGITTEGKFLYLTEEPPEGTSFKVVRLNKNSNIRNWKWNVSGNFDASDSLLTSVSTNVEFGGNVNIDRTGIKHWQNDVPGGFSAYGSLLETIADDVKFGGNVGIGGTRIKHWLHDVPGGFFASHSLLESVSANAQFGKHVDISVTRIKCWQHDVPGNFYAYNSSLKSIADNVKFGGNVGISGTYIKHWKHDVPGDFFANASLLETISDNVKFGGDVEIGGTRMKRWHHDVLGNFFANASLLEVIAANVKFGGTIDISETKAEGSLTAATRLENYTIMPEQ